MDAGKELQFAVLHAPPDVYIHGTTPNVGWRHITTQEIRAHPNYKPLPPIPPNTTIETSNFQLIPEDTTEWHQIHDGRITTSLINTALAFNKPHAIKELNIHYIRHIKDLTQKYSQVPPTSVNFTINTQTSTITSNHIWKPNPNQHCFFNHIHESTSGDIFKGIAPPDRDVFSARIAWGSIQEPIGTLFLINLATVLNCTIHESGMRTFNFPQSKNDDFPKDICAATPDGVFTWFDTNQIEPIEIKSVCPFIPSRQKGAKMSFATNRQPYSYLSPQFVAQLQWHIASFGPECTSALYMSVSPLGGVKIFRVYRNEEWLELAYEIIKLTRRYCLEADGEVDEFKFKTEEDQLKHLKLIRLTKEIAMNAKLMVACGNDAVQRGSRGVNLFMETNKVLTAEGTVSVAKGIKEGSIWIHEEFFLNEKCKDMCAKCPSIKIVSNED